MINKLVTSDSYDFGDLAARLVPLHRSGVDHGWMQKHASSDVFARELASLRPQPNKTILHIIALGDEEAFGCLVAGSQVVMADGSSVPIEKLYAGENLSTGVVSHTFSRTVAETVVVDVEGIHEPVRMSIGHPLLIAEPGSFHCIRWDTPAQRCKPGRAGLGNLCQRGAGCVQSRRDFSDVSCQFAEAKSLTTEDYLVYQLPDDKPPRHISEDEARLIGYWLAEGSFTYAETKRDRHVVAKRYAAIQFSFGAHETDTYVADVVEILRRLGIKATVHQNALDHTANVHSNLCEELVQEWLSWFGTGAKNKHLPLWTCNLPESVRVQLAYGYLCGDGTVHDSSKGVRVCGSTVSRDLAYGVQRLLWSLGTSATVCLSSTLVGKYRQIKAAGPPTKVTLPTYMVSYSPEKAPDLLKFGAAPRQGSKVRNFVVGRTVYLAVRSVKTVSEPVVVYNVEVAPSHTYVSYNFLSHNCNRNGDAFNREDNVRCHPRFKKLGYLFRNHKNTDPAKAVGGVLATAHNDQMSRVELLVGLDNKKCAAEVEAINNGDDVPFSMGSSQEFDVCSICGHKAPTAADHCGHIKHMLGEVLSDGRKVYMKNPDPKFFDISIVHKPADRIAYSLRKVASAGTATIGGHELAEMYGLSAAPSTKVATMQALAEIVKEIPLTAKGLASPNRVRADTKQELRKLCAVYGLDQVLGHLTKHGMMLAPQDFADVATGCPEAEAAVNDSCGCGLDDIMDDHEQIEAFDLPRSQEDVPLSEDAKEDLSSCCGMQDQPARRRAMIVVIQKPSIKTAFRADPTTVHGLSMLYKHYKVAFAHAHAGNAALVRTVATTF